MNNYSDFLFAKPSFIEGVSRVLDIGSTLTEYNTSLNGVQADIRAMSADWKAVGEDMKKAVQTIIDQHAK